MIKKSSNGWVVDVQPAGRGGKRFRKTFENQAEAKKWEAWIKTQAAQSKSWLQEKNETRKLSVLV